MNEAADGFDTLEWISQQTWSNGVVGMWGDSYYGFTQWAAASTGHPALRAISPRLTGTRLGELPVDRDAAEGAWTREVEMGVNRLYACTYFHANDNYYWEPDWSRRPYAAQVEEFFEQVGSRSTSYDLWFPEPVTLRRFPFGHPFDARAIPVLQTIGWWDNCAPWQWADHWALSARQTWAHNEFLLIDSIDHENNHLLDGPGEKSAEQIVAALPRYLDPTIEFFDVFLRDRGTASSIPKVRWNLAHTEGLRVSETWPPAGVEERRLLLHSDGRLTNDGDSAEEAQEIGWVHDPDDLVPSPVENAFAFLAEYPDESAWAGRTDVLCFDAESADVDVDLVGGVALIATVTSDGPRMDVFARVLDVDPAGAAHLVARGQVHVVDTSSPRRVRIDLGQIGYRLRAGHRLRLHVCSSDFPEFVPQPGTGEHPWLAKHGTANRQGLRLGGADPAVLVVGTLRRP